MTKYPINDLVLAYREVRGQLPESDDGDAALRVVLRKRFPDLSEEQIRDAEDRAMREDEKWYLDRVAEVYREIVEANPRAKRAKINQLFAERVSDDPALGKSWVRATLRQQVEKWETDQ